MTGIQKTTRISPKKQANIINLLERMPAENSHEEEQIVETLLGYGPSAIREICFMLVPQGTGDDTKARYALSSLTNYVSRPQSEKKRKMYVGILCDGLEYRDHHEIKAFLIRQLQQVGKDESIPALGKYLSSDRLCEPATQALITIGTPLAEAQFLNILPEVKGKNKITIIKALGVLKSEASLDQLVTYCSSENQNIRLAALFAIANIGDPSTVNVLTQATETTSSFERIKATSYMLLYARRLSENGHQKLSTKICRDLIKDRATQNEPHVQAAALKILTDTLKENALNDLLTIMDSSYKELRMAALKLAVSLPGDTVTETWIMKLNLVSPEVQAEIITMLGERGDRSVFSVLVRMLEVEDEEVREATIPAITQLGGMDALPALLVLLKESDQPAEIEAVKIALTALQHKKILPLMVDALPAVSAPSQAMLLDILHHTRHSEIPLELIYTLVKSQDSAVRLAAIRLLENLADENEMQRLIELLLTTTEAIEQAEVQRAIVTITQRFPDLEKRAESILLLAKNSTGREKAILLQTAGRIGGENVFQTILSETTSEDRFVKEASIRTLADWPDINAIDELLKIAKKEEDILYHTLALRGSVRILQTDQLSPEEKIKTYREIMSITRRPEEKRLVLSGLSNVKTVESLKLVATYMNDDTLSFDAAIAILKIVSSKPYEMERLSSSEVAMALITTQLDNDVSKKIEEQYSREPVPNMPPEEFTPLFNGRNLHGWKGWITDPIIQTHIIPEEQIKIQMLADENMVKHWSVSEGTIISDGYGQNLCTIKKYDDFELRIDWKIERGGDSGIFLRGSLEIQICDPELSQEGSGGLIINKHRLNMPHPPADNPMGEWNTFKIIIIDDKVTVYLNGKLVVDNLIFENYKEPDRPIYSTGQIELQARDTTVTFRNIFIREIPLSKPRLKRNLFNGIDLSGWQQINGKEGNWKIDEKILFTDAGEGGWLSTVEEYENFTLELEFRLSPGGNSGVFLRAPHWGDPAYTGIEIQLLDDYAKKHTNLEPWQYTGSIYGVQAPSERVSKKADQWQKMVITCNGPHIQVLLNNIEVVNTDIIDFMNREEEHPGLKHRKGFIGLQNHNSRVEYRNILITELE